MFAGPVLLVECSQALYSKSFLHQSRALDGFAVFALVITFILRSIAQLPFGPFGDNVHMYGPILNRITIALLLGFLIFRLYQGRLSGTVSAMHPEMNKAQPLSKTAVRPRAELASAYRTHSV